MNATGHDGPIRPKAVLICGPTASGKSALAMRIAQERDGIIINADSMQVYSCWRILTARPSKCDESMLPHALYGHVHKGRHYSVGAWIRDLENALSSLSGRLPIIVGGTGLYFTALLDGLAPIPEIPAPVRQQGMQLLSSKGLDGIVAELSVRDPETAAALDLNNPARVMRAWEVLTATGCGLVHWQQHKTRPLFKLKEVEPLLVCPDPADTAANISDRLDRMLADGLIEECREAIKDWTPSMPYTKALGAREFRAHLEGGLELEAAVSRTCAVTRQFAKRQRTWFRSRMRDWQPVSV